MGSKMLVLGMGLWVALCLGLVSRTYSADQPEIDVHVEAHTVSRGLFGYEAIVPSSDGSKLVFLAKEKDQFQDMPATTPFLVTKTGDQKWGPSTKILSKGLSTSIAFGNHDRWIVTSVSYFGIKALKNLVYLLFRREKLGDLSGFKHRIEIYDAQTYRLIHSFDSKHFGLRKSEILKHARISPDGKWLAFYTHSFVEQRGVYLYHFASQKTWRLGDFDDKHPTWTPDGTKILFHSQRGGNSHTDLMDDSPTQEQAFLGYYEMDLTRGSEDHPDPKWTRIMIDDPERGSVYRKHPAVLSGSDLLFFHAKDPKPEDLKDGLGASKLHVRRLGPGSTAYKITGMKSSGGVKVKKSKHVGIPSASAKGIYFVGREDSVDGKGQEAPLQVFFLDSDAISRVDALVPKLH